MMRIIMPTERVQRQIDAFLDDAEAALRSRDWDAALECMRAVLSVDPENEDALSFKGMAEAGRSGPRTGSLPDGPSEDGAAPSPQVLPDGHLPRDGEKSAAPSPQPSPEGRGGKSEEVPASFAGGRYVVERLLGEGGKKRVYLAHDVTLDRDVAFGLIKAEGLEVADRVPPPANRLIGHSRVTGRAVELAPTDTVGEARSQIRHGWIVAISDGDLEMATPYIERAEELASSLGDTEIATLVHGQQGAINGNYLKWEECAIAGREYLRKIAQMTPNTRNSRTSGLAIFGCMGMTALGDSKTSETLATLELATGERTNDRPHMALFYLALISTSLVTGNWTKARGMTDRLAGIRGAKFVAYRKLILEAQTTVNSERIDEFVSHTGLGDYSSVGDLLNQGARNVALLAVAGRILGRQDFLEHAGEYARRALDLRPPLAPLARRQLQVSVSLDMISNRDASHARELYEELLASSGMMVNVDSLSGDHLLGLLADLSGESSVAAGHFEAAMVFCRDAGYRPELAWTMSDYAEMLISNDDDREKVGELQDEAIDIATELGMKSLLEKVPAAQA